MKYELLTEIIKDILDRRKEMNENEIIKFMEASQDLKYFG
jgi:hypothetical protein